MKIAIYSRKSKTTESGDSIASQISMCQEYAKLHFKDCEFIIYEEAVVIIGIRSKTA